MRGLERERIGNGLCLDFILIGVILSVFTITVPALFLAVVIPAYDRVFAVVERPAVAGGREGEERRVFVAFLGIAAAVNILFS